MDELTGLKGFSAWNVYNKVAFSLVFCRAYNLKRVEHSETIKKALESDDLETIKALIPQLVKHAESAIFSHAEVLADFKTLDDESRSLLFLEALTFCDLDEADVFRLLALHKDANGIGYSKANAGNIPTADLVPLMLESLVFCSRVDIDLGIISRDELDALDGQRVSVTSEAGAILGSNSNISLKDLIALSLKKAFKKG